MYKQIKNLADEAIEVQNKDRMDAALREISALCTGTSIVEQLESADGAALIGVAELPVPNSPAPVAKFGKKGGAK